MLKLLAFINVTNLQKIMSQCVWGKCEQNTQGDQ